MQTFKKSLITAAVLALTAGLLCACKSASSPFSPVTKTDDNPTATSTDGGDASAQWTVARDECTHDFTLYASKEADCVSDGYVIKRCRLCGETSITTTPALGHLFTIAESTATDASAQVHCARQGCSACYTETGIAIQSASAYALPLDGAEAVAYDPAGKTPDAADYVLLPIGNTTWGYRHLTVAERRFYAAAMQALLTFAETDGNLPNANEKAVCLSLDYTSYDLSETQTRTVLTYLTDDSPLLFWLDDTVAFYAHTVVMYVSDAWRDSAQRRATAAQLEALVQTVCGDNGIVKKQMEGAEDFDCAVAAYRAVKACLSYAETNDDVADTAAGALSGQCTPLGYARLFTIVCNRLGIPCITARGVDEGEGCNRIYLCGAWYAADPAADDTDDKDWLRCFGTTTAAAASSGTYPLPKLASAAVGPVTLEDQNGVIGRCISSTAAFAAMTDANGRYVITPDGDVADPTAADPFAWSYILPAGKWPRVSSLTISGSLAPSDVFETIGLTMQVPGTPVLSCPVIFRDVIPQASGLFILVGADVTFSGENATLAASIGGDETSCVTFDYSGHFTYTGYCRVGTVNFEGVSPISEGLIYVNTFHLGRGTNLELHGDFIINAQNVFLNENSALILTDRVSGRGALHIGAFEQNSAALLIKVRILSCDNYPNITFEDPVAVPVSFIIEDTESLPSAIVPDNFYGVLYTLEDGTNEKWTLTVAGEDFTAKTTHDAAGNYRFVRS